MATQAAARAKARSPKTAGVGHNSGDVPPREVAREPAREAHTTGYYDRDGNPLVRKNPGYRGEFDFKRDEVPEGWEYQWIRHTVHGDPSESELWDMQENGWRPVPQSRHAGRFGPSELMKGDIEKGKSACILRKGQLLVERPFGMCEEARAEQRRAANTQIGEQFNRFSVPLPDNVRSMGLNAPARGIARQTDDVGTIKSDFMPKHELEI